SHSQASALALVLKYGALPVKLVQADVQTVSATIGKSSLHAGLVAGLIGLALVLLYMIFYYRALGIVVMMGLSISAALLYSIVTYLGHSSLHQALSLSGVVGVIVSVGVTVDSYIVYFERLKDDIRAGKSIRTSVDRSFARAWRTIWTADLVSIIAALLLYWLTVGAVRGFAFFLGLSTALDLVVSYTFTRPMVFLLGRNRTFTEVRHERRSQTGPVLPAVPRRDGVRLHRPPQAVVRPVGGDHPHRSGRARGQGPQLRHRLRRRHRHPGTLRRRRRRRSERQRPVVEQQERGERDPGPRPREPDRPGQGQRRAGEADPLVGQRRVGELGGPDLGSRHL